MNSKRILLVPLDPVHDIGIKLIYKALQENGYIAKLLPPDRKVEEVVKYVESFDANVVMISRTLGYGVEELLSNLVDVFEATGIRKNLKLVIGGMAIKPELAQELGFDAGFGAGTKVEEIIAFLEDRPYKPLREDRSKQKKDLTEKYSYKVYDEEIKNLLESITGKFINWAEGKASPGIQRAYYREQIMDARATGNNNALLKELYDLYINCCDSEIASWYSDKRRHPKTAEIGEKDLALLKEYSLEIKENYNLLSIQHEKTNPLIFIQYGTGCPVMDITHIKISEDWGADGVVHFDPSWNSRAEGLLEGILTHQDDGSLITPENLKEIKKALNPATLWQIRAHRGLNTPETVVIAGRMGADLTKINIAYGSLAAGTDPERLAVDAINAIGYARKYNMPFDVVTNEELSGVPAYKAFAGMLIVVYTAIKLQARPILQPLFCYSPEMMLEGQMHNNYVDYNAAKVLALRSIIDGPIWPGAPIGFLTHTEDRVQAATTTALHAALGSTLEVDGISISSSDEAYSRGPITSASRVDTLKSTREAFRFFGNCKIEPTERVELFKNELVNNIKEVLDAVNQQDNFVDAIYKGIIGSEEDGVYPGRFGQGTVK